MNLFKTNLDERREMILNGDIVKAILFLTIPTFMMAIVQTLIPFSDSLFLNIKLGTDVGAAISYVQPAINMLISLSQGLGVVAMSIIGQLNGKNDVIGVKKRSLEILLFGLFIGVCLIPIAIFAAQFFVPNDNRLKTYALIYFSLSSMIIPFQFMASIFNSIKSAIGEPESSFYRMVVLLLLKLIFNSIYLLVFNLGIYGSIMASLSSYILTGIWMYYDLFIREYKFKLNIKEIKFDYKFLKEVIRLSIPSMMTYMGINLGFFLINREVVIYGADVLAGLAIASQINGICFTMPTCVATTVTTMISMNIGVGNVEKSKKIFRKGLLIGNIVALILVLLIIPNSKYIVMMFKPSLSVEKIAMDALNYYTYSAFAYTVFMMCQSVYNALGRNVYPLIMTFLRVWVFRYFFIVLTHNIFSYYSVFYGNLFSNFMSAIIFYIIVSKSSWRSEIQYE